MFFFKACHSVGTETVFFLLGLEGRVYLQKSCLVIVQKPRLVVTMILNTALCAVNLGAQLLN